MYVIMEDTQYDIENNIDFFTALKKALEEEDTQEQEYQDICLITKEPLADKHVTLECGHKFNYIPLYNDLVNHKTKFNKMERRQSGMNEIRCPYCRSHQKKLLPYYEELHLAKEPGVNCPELFFMKNSKQVYCCAFQYPDTILCGKANATKINVGDTDFGDTLYYCSQHKSEVVKKYKLDIKLAKQQNAKQCTFILKVGINKGKPCCKTVYDVPNNTDQLCKRHYTNTNAKNEKDTNSIKI